MIKKVTISIILLFALFAIPFIGRAQNHTSFNLDLIWSASTMVPDDYEGRSLPTRGSTIEVVALTGSINRNSLNYEWFLDRDFIKHASGRGKNAYSFKVSTWSGFSHTARVVATDSATGESQTAVVVVNIIEPEIDISNPNPVFKGEPALIEATPYFFTEKDLDYDWSFNFQEAGGNSLNPGVLVLEIGGSYGLSTGNLDLVVKNPNNPFEQVRKRVNINVQ